MPGLTLAELSDREVLAIVADCIDAEGVTTTADVALRMNLSTPRPERNVSSRLSWLRRYGVLDRDPAGRWFLTDFGIEMTNGSISRSAESALERLRGAQWVTLMQEVAARRYLSGSTTEALMMRRAWTYGTHPLRLGAR